jgi:hypothetical protein
MNAGKSVSGLFALAACLLAAGCDSKNPLSDPAQSKPDPRLAGIWRVVNEDGDTSYCHVGRAGDKLPPSVMVAVCVTHTKDGKVEGGGQMLLFPTVLGNTPYLNVAGCSNGDNASHLTKMQQEGWKPGLLESYSICKYRIDGDKLLLWLMAEAAKKQAIASGKIKGSLVGPTKIGPSVFTDSTENVARFVAAAGDSLFEKEPKRLERVK